MPAEPCGMTSRQCVDLQMMAPAIEQRVFFQPYAHKIGDILNRRSFIQAAVVFVASMVGVLAGGLWLFLKQAKFGGNPTNSQSMRIARSPNFRNGAFQNQLATPMMTGEDGGLKTILNFVFNRNKRLRPTHPIPSVRCNLSQLAPTEDVLVWFGHSSYLLQIDGKRILVDPVLSGRASPVSFTTKAFDGTDPYSAADIPDIDFLFITHDHGDRLYAPEQR